MKFEYYTENTNILENFTLVRKFLKELTSAKSYENWHWARWGWLMGHPNFQDDMLKMIGLWKDDNKIVGITTHDMRAGEAYIICKPDNCEILKEMVEFAEQNIAFEGKLSIIVYCEDNIQNDLLESLGYCKTDKQEVILGYDFMEEDFSYSLPNGFSVTSCKDEKDINKYVRVVWNGFENEGEPPIFDNDYDKPLRENWKEELSIFIKAPNGDYVAHCGMWYEEGEKTAYIEPVCTVPEYRNKGLAKIAIYESMKRCSKLGAKRAIVISNQEFYYKIGFKVSTTYFFWEKRL